MFDLDQAFGARTRLRFGGTTVVAAPLRLRQLAALQAWLRSVAPHPLEEARGELMRLPDGPERRERAASLWREGEHWPVRLFSAAADPFLFTPEGRAELADVGLTEANPAVDARSLARTATAVEWGALSRILFGTDPAAQLIGLADPDDEASDEADPINWGRLVADLVADGRALTDVAEWTLDQLTAVRHRGDRPSLRPRPRGDETIADAAVRRSRALGIPDDAEPDPTDPSWLEALELAAILGTLDTNGGGGTE